jgi:hypothetical protein
MPRYYTYDLGRGAFCSTPDDAPVQPIRWLARWEITLAEYNAITVLAVTPEEPPVVEEPPVWDPGPQ